MVEVDPDDPAFQNPTKPIGPMYPEEVARQLASERGWSIAPDGDGWRRVVPSPRPRRVFEIRPIRWLLDRGCIIVCTGGGGIPTMYGEDGSLRGAEVVIDKDRASALLAHQLEADFLVMATDVDAVYEDWGGPNQRPIHRTTPRELRALDFAAGSMGPKVEAAYLFVDRPGRCSAIGALRDLESIVARQAGTIIEPDPEAE
jgi:carbamate kinase